MAATVLPYQAKGTQGPAKRKGKMCNPEKKDQRDRVGGAQPTQKVWGRGVKMTCPSPLRLRTQSGVEKRGGLKALNESPGAPGGSHFWGNRVSPVGEKPLSELAWEDREANAAVGQRQKRKNKVDKKN